VSCLARRAGGEARARPGAGLGARYLSCQVMVEAGPILSCFGPAHVAQSGWPSIDAINTTIRDSTKRDKSHPIVESFFLFFLQDDARLKVILDIIYF
jgi:hypothetical protein